LRSKIESSVKEKADILFKSLLSGREELGLELFEPAPKNPYKLRNSYYWQIVVKCPMVRNCIEYLKKNIRNFSHSQVIITIDVDAL
jgi:primosomal protein N'